MPGPTIVLVFLGLLAVTQVQAADKSDEKSKGGSKVERAIENTGKKLGKTADQAEKSVTRGLKKAEKGINTAGEKAGKWLNEKTK